nr:hypothetical protein BaRGS_016757 [Batillaria attramentaria]
MFIDMLNHPDLPKLDLSTLYTGIMAGSPCPIDVMRKVMDKMHMTEVTQEHMLLAGSPKLDRSKGRGQTNVDHLSKRLNGFA